MAITYIDKGEVFGGMHLMEITGTSWTDDEALVPGMGSDGTDVFENVIPKAYPGSTYKEKGGSQKVLYPDDTWA